MHTSQRHFARAAFLCSAAAAVIALAAPHGALAGAAALPTGGAVQSGQASIAASGPGALVISQASKSAIIDWSSFSIGQGGSVTFNNGAGATLNRVLAGGPVSSLDGRLSATGSVYLINPSGVIIGKDGVVKVGGTFAASTLDVDDAAFLNGGALTFSGASKASVVNLGKVEALGGDVVLAAAVVKNAGSIQAPNGEVGLLAGYAVTLKDQADQNGLFTVQIGGMGTAVTNEGVISAAVAELRANGGNIYALAGNTSSLIKASEVSNQGGQIFLTAPGGTVSVASGATLDASGIGTGSGGHILVDGASTSFHGTALAEGGPLGGDGGLVETSGGTLDVSGAKVIATAAHGQTGTWLLDPYDLTVNAAGAAAIETGLAGANVTVQTSGSSASTAFGVADSNGSGDITIAAPITWSSGHALTLDAYRSLHVDAPITVAGGGGVVIKTNDGGSGGDYDFGLTATGFSGRIDYTAAPTSGATLTINGTPYTLLYSMSDVQNINASAAALQGNYALATSLNAASTGSWAPIGTDGAGSVLNAGFSGAFTGLGHTISNLKVDLSPTAAYAGLFGYSTGTIRDIGVVGGSVSGKSYVGGLVGYERAGTISDAFATGTASGGYYVGGLVGVAYGAITNAFATGAVSATGGSIGNGGYAGGLVGWQTGGTISNAYATGAVSSGGYYVGGLVGMSGGAISNAYATGAVTGIGGQFYIGGLVGEQGGGSITNAYATGAVSGGNDVGGLVGELYGAGVITNAYATGTVTGSLIVGGLVGSLQPTAGGAAGTITDAYATGAVTAAHGGYVGGLVGWLGDGTISSAYATGAVTGIDPVGGLVGYLQAGAITNAFATGAVSAAAEEAGGLVGTQAGGAITNAYATGAVTGIGTVGGLVGNLEAGTISNVYATGAVTGDYAVGGLVGGQSGGAISNAYYDTQTTGQKSDGAGAVGLTTRQLQGLDPILGSTYFSLASNLGDNGATWGGGAGGLYPYLKTFFPHGVQAVSGVAYEDGGATVAASGANGAVTVGLDAGGVQIAQATTGANGYYYIVGPAGTVASGQGLVAYTTADSATGAANAASYVEIAGASGLAASGLNLYGGWLVQQGGAADTTLSGLNSLYAATIGSTAPSTFNLANRQIESAASSFTVDTSLAAAGAVELSTAGSLTLASGAGVSAGSGDDVTLAAAGAFINQAGASAVTVSGGGRWLIYSSAPDADVFGGLNSNNTAVWNTAAGAGVSASGDRYVFAYQPTLTVTTTSDSKTAGVDATGQIQADYVITGVQPGVAGAFLGDSATAVYSGAPSLASAGAGASATVGSYAITASWGTLTAFDGYAIQFANTGQLTVAPPAPTFSAANLPFPGANGASSNVFNGPTSSDGLGFGLLPGFNSDVGGGGGSPPQGQGSPGGAPYPDNQSYSADIRFEGGSAQ